jgi:hypothetical protein
MIEAHGKNGGGSPNPQAGILGGERAQVAQKNRKAKLYKLPCYVQGVGNKCAKDADPGESGGNQL